MSSTTQSPALGRATATALGALSHDRQVRASHGYWRRAWRRFRQNYVSLSALIVLTCIIVFALSAGLISSYVTHYTYAANHLSDKLTPPFDHRYWLGTDGNGRDELTRLAYGGRVSLYVAAL